MINAGGGKVIMNALRRSFRVIRMSPVVFCLSQLLTGRRLVGRYRRRRSDYQKPAMDPAHLHAWCKEQICRDASHGRTRCRVAIRQKCKRLYRVSLRGAAMNFVGHDMFTAVRIRKKQAIILIDRDGDLQETVGNGIVRTEKAILESLYRQE